MTSLNATAEGGVFGVPRIMKTVFLKDIYLCVCVLASGEQR